MKIRNAHSSDASAILAIYKPFVLNSHVSFEYEVPEESEIRKRIEVVSSDYPYLVLEDEHMVIGFAYATRFRERKAYDACAETSIYLHPDVRGKGWGKLLYQALFNELKQQQITRLFAVISLPNEDSVRFHEACGFRLFGKTPEVGYKLNKWWGLAWMQLTLKP